MNKSIKYFAGFVLALTIIVVLFVGIHSFLEKQLGDDFIWGYAILFFSLWAVGLLFLAVRFSIKKIGYLKEGSKEKAAKIDVANQIMVPGIFGLVLVGAIIYLVGIVHDRKYSLYNELVVNQKGRRIEIPISNVKVVVAADSTVLHRTNSTLLNLEAGDIYYSPQFTLVTEWKDSTTSNSYEFKGRSWSYDPTSFLKIAEKFSVYIDPMNPYQYYFDDSFLPDAQWKRYDANEMREQLMVNRKGKQLSISSSHFVIDHHHVNTETPSNKKNARIFCCYVMMAAWKNPATGEIIPFKTQHFQENDPAEKLAKQTQIKVYIDPSDVWRYYVDVSFMDN